MDKKIIGKFRLNIQVIALLLQNANFRGFFTGRIYQGSTKSVCVPGLNCYSCPGAVGSCPIGSLQNALSAYKFRFPYYVMGMLIFFGTLLGRVVCGFLCPFGLLQDLLHKIPFPKKIRSFPGDRLLRKLKYVILIVLVIVLPVCVKLTPFFCKYLCPSGTLAGLLLSISDSRLFAVLGSRFVWKLCIFSMIVLASVVIFRPFCKYLCPLGAFYAPFNRIALIRMTVDQDKCVQCGKCSAACQMGVDPITSPNHTECIRCGACNSACPTKAIHFSAPRKSEKKTKIDSI